MGLFKQLHMNNHLSWFKSEVIELNLSPVIPHGTITRVFGQPLEYLTLTEQGLPPFFELCTNFIYKYGLEEDGIFRKNGALNDMNNYRKQ